jgi:hypothetical protein
MNNEVREKGLVVKIIFAILATLLIAMQSSTASPALSVLDYQDLTRKGTQGEQTITYYLTAVIDAIGMTNEEVVARKDRPIFCQERTITVEMVRGAIDRWITKNEPTMSPGQWRINAGKLNLSGAVLIIMKGMMPCNK